MAAIESPSSDDTIWLGEYLSVLRRRKWSIILVTLLAALAALIYGKQQTPLYQSTSQVLATTPLVIAGQGPVAPNMVTEQQFVTSDVVLKCVHLILANPTFRGDSTTKLDLDTVCSDANMASAPLDRFLKLNITVTIISQSNVLTIAYNLPSPKGAEASSQAFSLAYVRERTVGAETTLDSLRKPLLATQSSLNVAISKCNSFINQAIDQAATDATNGVSTVADNEKIQNLEAKRSAGQQQLNDVNQQLSNLDPSKLNPPQIILPAGLPPKPVSPDMLLLGAFGVLAGLALGVGIAFLRERLDDSLRGRVDLESNLGVPVLAVIPKVPGWRKKSEARLVTRDQPKSAVAEAYRSLRTSVVFASLQKGAKTIMVVSPASGEGKTTTAANLALVLAEAGKRVVMVSGGRPGGPPRLTAAGDAESLRRVEAGGVEVHHTRGAAAPQQRVNLSLGGRAGAPPRLLIAGDAKGLGGVKSARVEVHHARRAPFP